MTRSVKAVTMFLLITMLGTSCNYLDSGKNGIELISSGPSKYSIVYSSNATEAEKTAASELAAHLKLFAGIVIPLKEEKSENGPAIYVGQTEFARAHGISFKNYGSEEWLIKSVGSDIIIGGGRPRGTLYGVFEFLEKEVGIMWMDENYTYIPRSSSLSIPENLDKHGKPMFSMRGVYVFAGEPEKRIRFMIRNRENIFHDNHKFPDAEKWGIFPIYGSPRACHTFYNYTKDWPAEYMDCFSVNKDGKRLRAENPGGPGQVCLSNPVTRRLFIARLKEYIKADRKAYPEYYPLIYDISVNDNPDKCVCPGCLALSKKYGEYSGAMLEFINAIADGIANEYPDIKLQTFAYMFTEDAPKGIVPRPNVLMRVAQLDSEFHDGIRDTMRPLINDHNKKLLSRLQEWGAIGKIAIWDYWILFSNNNEATLNIGTISENLRLYKENNVKAVFAEYERPDTSCFYSLRLWVGYQLLQDPDQNVDRLTDKFMRAYYGVAAPFMKELADYIEKRMNELKNNVGDVSVVKRTYLDNDFFEKTENLLVSAEKAANGNKEILIRISKERVPLDLARLKRRERVSENLPPGRDAVVKRLQKNWAEAIKSVYPDPQQKSQLPKVDYEIKRLSMSASAPIPPEFKDRDVVDILWTSFNPLTALGANIVDVPEAAGGKAIKLTNPKGIVKSANNHSGGLSIGLYSASRKKELISQKISPEKLPQDEMFHLYSLGKITLEPKCVLWVHQSWIIQHKLWEFYESNGLPNDYEIYVSLKLEGPSYVKDSKKHDAIYMDRILLVRPDKKTQQ